MKASEAIEFFGSGAEVARRLNLRSRAAVSNWKNRDNDCVPELYARKLHELTRGRLRFDKSAYENGSS